MDNVGKRMKALQEANRLSQAEIAKLCGSNQATIAKTETGKKVPSMPLLIWWADYFDVSLDYLCCRTDSPQGKLSSTAQNPPPKIRKSARTSCGWFGTVPDACLIRCLSGSWTALPAACAL